MRTSIPLIKTLGNYNSSLAYSDLIAALIVTLMLIPQSLAYALLAGLPPEVGLYSSILPLIFYALFGTSSTLAVGPVAIVSLMTGAAIFSLSTESIYSPVQIAITLSFLSGLILIVMSFLKMGFVANFLSRSVIDGFIMASAILIAISQLKHIFAIDVQGHNLVEIGASLYTNIENYHLPTLLLGLLVIASLFFARTGLVYILKQLNVGNEKSLFITKVFPAIMIVGTILLMEQTAVGQMAISTVGFIPNGLPELGLPGFDRELFSTLLFPAALISIIGYVESISVARTFAKKSKDSIEPDNELMGLGAANIGSSISGGMPVTGGFSRSVVNLNAGAKTSLSGVMAAIFIALLTTGLMSLLEHLPKATLAATIIVAVLGLIDFKKLKDTWLFSKYDFALTVITIIITLLAGVEIGISTGIILSISLHLYHTSKPHMAVVGLVPGTEHFRNVLRHQVQTIPEIIGIRIDESLYFANSSFFEKEIVQLVKQSSKIRHCILQFSSVSDVDASALESLESINAKLKDMDVTLHLSEVKGPVMDKLSKTQLIKELTGKTHLSHFQAVKLLSKDLIIRNELSTEAGIRLEDSTG